MNSTNIKFSGPLSTEFSLFVEQMKANGEKHQTLFEIIHRLDKFLAKTNLDITILSREVLLKWFASFAHLKISTQRRYRSATFRLCDYLRRRHNRMTAVRENFSPLCYVRSTQPYIYSDKEILELLNAARNLSIRPSDPLRPWSYELIIVLLYTAGLRIGEVIRLNIGDYVTKDATLKIMNTKFNKSRLIPLSESATKIINNYLQLRLQLGLSVANEESLIWSHRHDHRPCQVSVQDSLYNLLRKCDLKPKKGKGKSGDPCVHHFRHSFAVHRILQWYKDNVDVQNFLPYLSIYMGHRNIESTQYYLTFIPEVLGEASKRFEQFVQKSIK